MASIFDELDREWRRLRVDRRAAAQLTEVCALAGVRDVGELADSMFELPRPMADRVLVVLVERAVAGDGLAARVLLQLLLPGVRCLARRWSALGDDEERAAVVVAAVWERIQCYPLARRPGRVAANILMDAAVELRRAWRRQRRLRPVAFVPGFEPSGKVEQHPALELAETLVEAVDAGVISQGEARLIAVSRIEGVPLRAMAEETGVPLRTLQWHRQCAEAALAELAPAVA